MSNTRTWPFSRSEVPSWLHPVLSKVWDKMKSDATGHDFLHAVRVMESCRQLAAESGADADVSMTAGLLHDYYRREEKTEGMLHFGPEAIRKFRREFGELSGILGPERFEDVLEAISLHENYPFDDASPVPLPLSARILQDADRLEAIGAVGVARAFMFSGAHGLPMYAEEKESSGTFDAREKPSGSAYRHFHTKLLRLADRMHTDGGPAPGTRKT